jgi:hypothetical protein
LATWFVSIGSLVSKTILASLWTTAPVAAFGREATT